MKGDSYGQNVKIDIFKYSIARNSSKYAIESPESAHFYDLVGFSVTFQVDLKSSF